MVMEGIRRLGLSTCQKKLGDELFRTCREAGVEFFEVSLPNEEYDRADFGELARLAERYGITLWTLHLPFMPFDVLDISRPELAEATLTRLKALICRGVSVGIRRFVVHASGEPIAEEERALRMACAKESLRTLAAFAAEHDALIAVEDLPRTCLGRCSADMLALLSADDRLRVCFDTNHLLGEEIRDFIRAVGDRIITTHISDYDGLNERHWLPGEGCIDFAEVVRELAAAGYSGPWLYEMGFDAPTSIDRPRPLTPMDFAENHRAIMQGDTPAPLGTPKNGLGRWDE